MSNTKVTRALDNQDIEFIKLLRQMEPELQEFAIEMVEEVVALHDAGIDTTQDYFDKKVEEGLAIVGSSKTNLS